MTLSFDLASGGWEGKRLVRYEPEMRQAVVTIHFVG
jgi:hypothetical protein